jgi:hypothetical protein
MAVLGAELHETAKCLAPRLSTGSFFSVRYIIFQEMVPPDLVEIGEFRPTATIFSARFPIQLVKQQFCRLSRIIR